MNSENKKNKAARSAAKVSRSTMRVLDRRQPRKLIGQSPELVKEVYQAQMLATEKAKQELLADKAYVSMLKEKFGQ